MNPLTCTRHALRDMRGSFRHFRLLFVCLCLGVAIMTCIGSTIAAIKAGIERDAKSLLGGDVEIQQIYGPVPPDVTAYITFNEGEFSRSADMRAMAEGEGDKRTLVEIKGVDEDYPLYGDIEYAKTFKPDVLFSNWHTKVHGAAVDQSLLDALGLKGNDTFTIGKTTFRVTAIIAHEPDRSISSFSLGPRVLVNMAAFKSTGLITKTSLIYWRYRIKLPNGVDATEWKERMQSYFPGAYWNIRDWRDSSSRIGQQIDRLSLFFVLTAMATLIIAGIGIGNAVSAYMWGKRHVIATLKCLGATQGHIYVTYLLELFMVATVAIAYGLLVGVGATYAMLWFLRDMLPVQSEYNLYPEPMMLSAAMGYLTVLMFGLIPLRQTGHIKPTSLFRGYVEPRPDAQPLSIGSLLLGPIYITLGAGMLWLAMEFTHTVRIPVYFALGLSFALSSFYLISLWIRDIAVKLGHKGYGFTTSMALGNMARPGAATTSVIIALGIGMSVLTALSLVSSNMRDQIDRSLPENAPAFFLLDVQPSQLDKITASLTKTKGVEKVRSLPLVRGRISKLNGILSEKVKVDEQVRWALDGTRGITFSATPPQDTYITEGTWWPADYKGKPLVSFDAKLARGMGLKVGDTITVAAVDKEITGTITNLRDIPWGSLEMNFTTVFSPGSLDNLPVTYLTTVTAPQEAETNVTDMLYKEYPSISIIRVRKALGNISDFLRQMSRAIYITAGITLLSGTLVMASAIHATLFKRKFDTVMMKVIGMTRRQIIAIYLKEFSFIALVAAVLAVITGSLSAYGIMQLLVFSNFSLMGDVVIITIAISLFIAIALGLVATRIALRVKPLALLRND